MWSLFGGSSKPPDTDKCSDVFELTLHPADEHGRGIVFASINININNDNNNNNHNHNHNNHNHNHTVKTRIKEQVFRGFRLILFLYIGCFLQNQLESVLKVFLKHFL